MLAVMVQTKTTLILMKCLPALLIPLQSSDKEFEPDDVVPLAVLRGDCPSTSEYPVLPEPEIATPKWKRAYSILAPEDYTPSVHLPERISNLAAHQLLTPLKVFQFLWTE